MSINWNPQQQSAIDHRGGSLLVGAAAGSGKTTVVVERIVKLLLDPETPVPADRLLVVTFSRAAAAELRVRVRRRLEQQRATNPEAARQLALLGRAAISTVHAFCAALLREFYALLDIPADFALADDLAAGEMREAAMNQTLAALYADPDSGFSSFSDLFGRARSDRDAAAGIERVYDFFTLLRDPKRFTADFLASLERGAPFETTPAGRLLLGYAAGAASSAVAQLEYCLALCELDGGVAEKYAPALAGDLESALALRAAVAAGDWDGCCALARRAPAALGAYRGDNKALAAEVRERRNIAKKTLADLGAETFASFAEKAKLDDAALLPAFRALFAGVELFGETLWKRKLRRKLLEFSDLERLAIELLSGESPEAAEIRSRYDAVFVDEFQDTNEVQNEIYRLLAQQRDNLFAVGDVKQSIYRFRSADPEVFIRYRAGCCAFGAGGSPQYLALNYNYRSANAVIDAVNQVFEPLMTLEMGGADYRAGEQLASERPRAGESEPGLELELVLAGEGEGQKSGEPRYVAERIRQMIDSGYEIELRDGTRRRCREGDFCVLLRSGKNRAPLYAAALKERGLSVWADSDAGFFESSEIEVLVALLGVIDNPGRDVDLAAVLLSPLFGFLPRELAALRAAEREGSLWALLQNSADAKPAAFLQALAEFRAASYNMPIDELLERIIDQTEAERLLAAGESAARRRNNIRSLLYFAADYADSQNPTLSGFLRQCRRARDQGLSLAGGFAPPKDAVSVITVHKAKGLEWPVVFLADAARRFNISDSYDAPVLFDSELGLGAKVNEETAGPGSPLVSRKTLRYRAVSRATRQKLAGEELRILYVALTRAMQKLVVTAGLKDQRELQKKLAESKNKKTGEAISRFTVAAQSCALDWLLLALWNGGEDAAADLGAGGPYYNGAVKISCASAPEQVAAAAPPLGPSPNPARAARLLAQISFRPPRAALERLPNKRSVSQLAKGGELFVAPPQFANTAAALAAKKGTATHLFMQVADYAAAARSAERELARLVAGGYIAKADAALIDTQKLKNFFKSELFARIERAEVLREYEFIDALDGGELGGDIEMKGAPVMIQGIADCVVLEPDGALIVDYKTDRVREPQQLAERYATQLALYKTAIEKRLGIKVKGCLLYSFELDAAVAVDLGVGGQQP